MNSFYNDKRILCPNCYSIPLIKITDESTCSIECHVCKQNQSFTIRKYLNQLELLNEFHQCDMPFHQGKNYSYEGKEYCTKCQKWLCESCLQSHNKTNKSHKTNKIYHQCLNKFSDKSEFYCFTCKYHFCKDCKSKHIKDQFTIVSSLIDSDEYEEKRSSLLDVKNYISNLETIKTKAVNYLKKEIEKVEEAYKENKEFNINLMNLLNVIYTSYIQMKPNYFQAMNIINNSNFKCVEYNESVSNTSSLISFLSDYTILGKRKQLSQSLSKISVKEKVKVHNNYINDMIILKDGRIATCSSDNSIKIMNMKTKRCEVKLKGHAKAVTKLIQLNNGNIVSYSADNTIKVWKIINKTKYDILRSILQNSQIISLVLFKNNVFITGSQDGIIKKWDENLDVYTIVTQRSTPLDIIKSNNKDDNTIIVIWRDLGMYIYGVSPFQIKSIIHTGYFSQPISMTEIENEVIICSDNMIYIYDIIHNSPDGSMRLLLEKNDKILSVLPFDNNTIIVSTKTGDLFEVDIDEFKAKNHLSKVLQGGISKIVKMKENEYVVSGDKEVAFIGDTKFNI